MHAKRAGDAPSQGRLVLAQRARAGGLRESSGELSPVILHDLSRSPPESRANSCVNSDPARGSRRAIDYRLRGDGPGTAGGTRTNRGGAMRVRRATGRERGPLMATLVCCGCSRSRPRPRSGRSARAEPAPTRSRSSRRRGPATNAGLGCSHARTPAARQGSGTRRCARRRSGPRSAAPAGRPPCVRPRASPPSRSGRACGPTGIGSARRTTSTTILPLELGGAVNAAGNLWPEPDYARCQGFFLNPKDRLENLLKSRVCAGRLPLATAQRLIVGNWPAAYRTYVGATSSGGGSVVAKGGTDASSYATAHYVYCADDPAWSARHRDIWCISRRWRKPWRGFPGGAYPPLLIGRRAGSVSCWTRCRRWRCPWWSYPTRPPV